jgi:MFS family permease
MPAHGHGLGVIGLVIGIHIGAMYLPSLVTGRLVDRLGRIRTAAAAGITLLLAGLTAALALPTRSCCSSSASPCSDWAGTSA